MAERPIPNLITILLVVAAAILVTAVALALTWMGMHGWALAMAAIALGLVAVWMLFASRALAHQHRAVAVHERDAPFRLVLANSPIVVLTVNAQGIITLIDGKGLKALGLVAEKLIGAAAFDFYPDTPQLRAQLALAQQGKPVNAVFERGSVVMETWTTPLVDEHGHGAGWIGLVIDLTARTRAEAALRESERKYRELLEQASDGIFITDLGWRFVEVNRRACEMLGYDHDELLSMAPRDLVLAEDMVGGVLRNEELQAGATLVHERRLRCRDGSFIDVEVSAKRIGETHIQAIVRDITERKRTEARLRAGEERFRELYNKTPAIMHSVDLNDLLLSVSDAWLVRFGYTRQEVLGRSSVDFMTAESRTRVQAERLPQFYSRGWSKDIPCQFVARSGEVVDVLISGVVQRDDQGNATGLMVVLSDVTDRRTAEDALKRSQEQLLHAQKMEAIGRLAGGMAHDFNNLLTAVIGFAENLKHQTKDRAEAGASIESILRVANRGANLTRQLLVFSRKQVIAPTHLDLSAVVSDLAPMLRRLIGEDIELVTSDLLADATIKADQNQIGQVLMNLTVNARDAMPRGGRLVISTRALHIEPTGTGIEAGEYIELRVQDNGLGMSDEVRSHLFEPFFTTKAAGTGTGLGLSIIYGIIKQSHGHVQVTSTLGQGSTFVILLPYHRGATSVTISRTPSRGVTIGAETILLVEDEEEIRNLLREMLEERGYQVIHATSGDDALRIYQERKPVIDLLLTDVVMPRMGGRELAEQLRMRQSDLKVLFMSGYTGAATDLESLHSPDLAFLPKPFTQGELLRKIRDMLAPGKR
jgi:two-component system cell cycle sensor histidine kinase/response regulator CckA